MVLLWFAFHFFFVLHFLPQSLMILSLNRRWFFGLAPILFTYHSSPEAWSHNYWPGGGVWWRGFGDRELHDGHVQSACLCNLVLKWRTGQQRLPHRAVRGDHRREWHAPGGAHSGITLPRGPLSALWRRQAYIGVEVQCSTGRSVVGNIGAAPATPRDNQICELETGRTLQSSSDDVLAKEC